MVLLQGGAGKCFCSHVEGFGSESFDEQPADTSVLPRVFYENTDFDLIVFRLYVHRVPNYLSSS